MLDHYVAFKARPGQEQALSAILDRFVNGISGQPAHQELLAEIDAACAERFAVDFTREALALMAAIDIGAELPGNFDGVTFRRSGLPPGPKPCETKLM